MSKKDTNRDEIETEERIQIIGNNSLIKQESTNNDDKSENKMSTTKYMDIINVLNNVVKDIENIDEEKHVKYLESSFVRSKQY